MAAATWDALMARRRSRAPNCSGRSSAALDIDTSCDSFSPRRTPSSGPGQHDVKRLETQRSQCVQGLALDPRRGTTRAGFGRLA